MKVYAIDPGPTHSALVVFDGTSILSHERSENFHLLKYLAARPNAGLQVLVIEQIAAMGMAVGAEVFETCVWSGRFIQAWSPIDSAMAWDRIKRHAVKQTLCGTQKAKDPNIRQALIDRFGPGKEKAIGLKRSPGPLFGIAGDEWSALAVAIAWWERNRKDGSEWKQ